MAGVQWLFVAVCEAHGLVLGALEPLIRAIKLMRGS